MKKELTALKPLFILLPLLVLGFLLFWTLFCLLYTSPSPRDTR